MGQGLMSLGFNLVSPPLIGLVGDTTRATLVGILRVFPAVLMLPMFAVGRARIREGLGLGFHWGRRGDINKERCIVDLSAGLGCFFFISDLIISPVQMSSRWGPLQIRPTGSDAVGTKHSWVRLVG